VVLFDVQGIEGGIVGEGRVETLEAEERMERVQRAHQEAMVSRVKPLEVRHHFHHLRVVDH
jgi:hypothetical protein